MFVNTTAIAHTKVLRLRPTFGPYAIEVVFTNVRKLRVGNLRIAGRELKNYNKILIPPFIGR